MHAPMSKQPRGIFCADRAFTLIETVLAIGIVATVLIALLGLLPTGSRILSEAGRGTVGARIAQQLIGEVQLAEFEDIELFNNKQRYYNDMGTELQSSGNHVYTARIEVESGNPEIPGAKASEYLKRVIIKVSNDPGKPDFSDPPIEEGGENDSYQSPYNRYSTLVVFTGQDKS